MSSTSRLYRALLRLYPASIRRMFGVEMLELVEARSLRERESGRPWATARANWFVLRDSIRAIPQAYRDSFTEFWHNRGNPGQPPRMSLQTESCWYCETSDMHCETCVVHPGSPPLRS
jgi:hypothetical protein